MPPTVAAASLSVAELNGDIRASAVEKQRGKDRRVKYRNVNMNLIGSPNSVGSATWNNRNKFKMPRPRYLSVDRRENEHYHDKRRKFLPRVDIHDVVCARRKGLPTLRKEVNDIKDLYNTPETLETTEMDDGTVDGVTYSYDADGPSGGEEVLCYAVSQAVEKLQTKELATLIKNEYDVVDASSSDYSDEEDFEFI